MMFDWIHIPRDYRYRHVPDWARSACSSDYNRYCDWLASYLMDNDFPMNEAQTECAKDLSGMSACSIAFTLGDTAGLFCFDYHDALSYAEEGMSYYDVLEHEWSIMVSDPVCGDPEIADEFEDIGIPEDDYLRICQEYQELKSIGEDVPPHADIGFRPLLAIAVKKCSSHEEAVKVIKHFYMWFNDSASK